MATEFRLSYTANEINSKLGKIDELIQAKESLTAVQISALDGMFKIAAYTEDAKTAYTAFKLAFGIEEPSEPDIPDVPDEPEVTLTKITATYSGGDVAVGTAVSALTGIVVTAYYSDGSTANVTGYTLSGTIAEGSNTIAVTYQGKTTTFAVTGVADSSGEGDVPDEPSEPIDTSPVIVQYDVGYNDKMVANARDGMCITQIYPYEPNIDAIKSGKYYDAENDYTTMNGEGGMIIVYAPSLKGRESGYSPTTTGSSKIVRFRDGITVGFHSNICLTSSENPVECQISFKRYVTDDMYANGIAFTLSTLDIDDSYAYWENSSMNLTLPVGVEDGDIIFAGKNTKYYGMRNISQYTGE